MRKRPLMLVLALLLPGTVLSTYGQRVGVQQASDSENIAPQERQCMARGWKRVAMTINGESRELLWNAADGYWSKGAIVVLHGGGGEHFQWCVADPVNFSLRV